MKFTINLSFLLLISNITSFEVYNFIGKDVIYKPFLFVLCFVAFFFLLVFTLN